MWNVERHGACRKMSRNYKLFIFCFKLITELVFEEEGNLLGAHISEAGLGFDGKVFGRVNHTVNHLKAGSDPQVWL